MRAQDIVPGMKIRGADDQPHVVVAVMPEWAGGDLLRIELADEIRPLLRHADQPVGVCA